VMQASLGSLGQQSAPRSPMWFGPVVELSIMAVILWFLFTQAGVPCGDDDATMAS